MGNQGTQLEELPSPTTERRQAQRLAVLESEFVTAHLGSAGGLLINISESGLGVHSVAPVKPGDRMPVFIDMPKRNEPFQLSGVVAWSEPGGGAGLRLVDLSGEQRRELRAWMREIQMRADMRAQADEDDFSRIVSVVNTRKLKTDVALELIVERAVQLTSANGAAIALGPAGNLVCRTSAGVAPTVGAQIRPNSGLTGECIRTRKLIHCEDTQNDSRVDPEVCRELNLGSTVILPMLGNGELLGVFEVFSPKPHAFSQKNIERLKRLADAVLFVTHGIQPPPAATATLPSAQVATAGSPSAKAATPNVPIAKPVTPTPTPNSPAAPVKAEPKQAPVVTAKPAPKTPPNPPAKNGSNGAPAIAKTALPPVAPVAKAVSKSPAKDSTENAERMAALLAEDDRERASRAKWITAGASAIVLAVAAFLLWPHHASQPNAPNPAPTSTHAPVNALATIAQAPSEKITVPAPQEHKAKLRALEDGQPTDELAADVVQPAPIVLAPGTPPAPKQTLVEETSAPAVSMSPAPAPISLPSVSEVPKLAAPVASGTLTGGQLLHRVNPIYPKLMNPLRLAEDVIIEVTVLPDGRVGSARRLKGNIILADAAVKAIKQWKYEPFKIDGKPVQIGTIVDVKFEPAR